MTLYANGCSMTYGAELAGELTPTPEWLLTKEQNEFRKAHSWPGVVGRLLGQPVINGAMGGAANERIVRTTIHDVVKHNLGPKDIAVIGWTECERFEYMKDDMWVQQTVNFRPSHYSEKRFVDDWARLQLNSIPLIWERFLTQVLAVQSVLEARGITYLMFNALPAITIEDFPGIPKELEHLKYAVNLKRWITPIDFMPDCMFCQIKHHPCGPELHPLREGHQQWGQTVYDFYTELHP